MKYEFTGTVKDDEPMEYKIVIASIILISSLVLLLPGFYVSERNIIPVIISIILAFASYIYITNYYNKTRGDEKFEHGEICKIRLHDTHIEIGRNNEKIKWDTVKYVKEHWYLERFERSSKELQIVFESKTKQKRIYLIETPDIGSSKSRYVNTQVDKKKYNEVLKFLKTKAKFIGNTYLDN